MADKIINKQVSLVTGGTTGIGIAIIRRLLAAGDEVRVIFKDVPEKYPEWRQVPPGTIPYVSDLTFKSADDQKNLEAACKGVSRVFHLAGATFNTKFNLDQLIDTNVVGTENLLKSVISANPKSAEPVHLLFPSTTTVYGYRRTGETLTELSEEKPASHYAESKLMAEHLIQSFAESHKEIIYTIFRIGTLYGPGYEKPHFYKAFRMVKEHKMRYIGNGANHLPMIHVKDAADAMMLASQKPKSAGNQTFNLTDGAPHTPKELFGLVAGILGVDPPTKRINPTVARMLIKAAGIDYDEYEFLAGDRIVSIAKIKEKLGFVPERRIEIDGLVMVEEFMVSYKKSEGRR